MVLVLTAMCSFSFAAEAPEEESDEVMGSAVLCPNCGSPNTKSGETLVQINPVHTACTHHTYGEDTYNIYIYKTKITCSDCLVTTEIYHYTESAITCNGYD